MDFTPQRKSKEKFNRYIKFDMLSAKNILIKLVFNLEGIFYDKKKNCLAFPGGFKLKGTHIKDGEEIKSIETENNKAYINSIEREIMNVFKDNANWCNQRKSKYRVANMIRWIIRQIYKQPVKKTLYTIPDAVKNYQVSVYPLPPFITENKYVEIKPRYIEPLANIYDLDI